MKTLILTILYVAFAFQDSFSQQIVFRQPSSYVLGFIGNDSISLSSVNYKSFRIYFKDSSYTANHLDNIKQELDIAYNKILSVLNIPSYDKGIYLLAVDSKEEMQKVMGYKIKGGAAKGHDLVFFVYNQNIRPQFKHEIFHLISYETWGLINYRLLDEGSATTLTTIAFITIPCIPSMHIISNKKSYSL